MLIMWRQKLIIVTLRYKKKTWAIGGVTNFNNIKVDETIITIETIPTKLFLLIISIGDSKAFQIIMQEYQN